MLVLSRKRGEAIIIGGEIEVVVLEVRGDQVRLGIKAPPHVHVLRRELYEEIKEFNREAAAVDPQLVNKWQGGKRNEKRGNKENNKDITK
ncbi:MAG: carbon storage regulator [Eubacteriales bacterium]|nr:carbon storage regulator [Eubacteriales bacterium]